MEKVQKVQFSSCGTSFMTQNETNLCPSLSTDQQTIITTVVAAVTDSKGFNYSIKSNYPLRTFNLVIKHF
jgi:hypothetical protein